MTKGTSGFNLLSDAMGLNDHVYYCRGCGLPLPIGFHGLFHRDCLQKDKRRRVQEERRLEYAKFQKWLQQRGCPKCRPDTENSAPRPSTEVLCEASQRARAGGFLSEGVACS